LGISPREQFFAVDRPVGFCGGTENRARRGGKKVEPAESRE
jgi:hypothetical protein